MKEGNRSRLASSVSRRAFLGSSAAAAAGCLIAGSRGAEAIPAVTAVKTASEARVRTDLLDEKSHRSIGREIAPIYWTRNRRPAWKSSNLQRMRPCLLRIFT